MNQINKLENKWDRRYLKMAKMVASWSKDPSTQCGAVIVRPDRTVASLGFNGFPAKIKDDEAVYADRPAKYSRIIHAEANAIRHAREQIDGYTVYVWPMPPCDRCASNLISYDIARVVCPAAPADQQSRWADALKQTEAMFQEAGVIFDVLVLPDLTGDELPKGTLPGSSV